MNGDSVVQIIALLACLVLVGSAYASHRLEWKSALRQVLIWGAIFASVTLAISLMMEG